MALYIYILMHSALMDRMTDTNLFKTNKTWEWLLISETIYIFSC